MMDEDEAAVINDERLSHMMHAFQKILTMKGNDGSNFRQLGSITCALLKENLGTKLYSGLKEVIVKHLQTNIRQEVLNSRYTNNFLPTLIQAWNDYRNAMAMIRSIVGVVKERRLSVPTNPFDNRVENLGLTLLFRNQVIQYECILDYLRETLLDMIMRERKGEEVDRSVIKSACQMLIRSDFGSMLYMYEEVFEKHFLSESAEFYRVESQKFLADYSVTTYIQYVVGRIAEEVARAKHCLSGNTEEKITKMMRSELITKHIETMFKMENSGVIYMFENQKVDDLAEVYRFLSSNVADATKMMFDYINQYICEQGKLLVREDDPGNAVSIVQNLLDLKDKADHVLKKSFSNDAFFAGTIRTDFESILDSNDNLPEYLSLFIDDKLKKSVKEMTEEEIECYVNKTAVLLEFLKEKDVFMRYHRQHLAKRLLSNESVRDNCEKSMISKLEIVCGCLFTSKLEGMMRDMTAVNSINEQFKEHVRSFGVNLYNIELNMRVLNPAFWPIHRILEANVPSVPNSAYQAFKRFYVTKYRTRHLTLQPQLGSAEMSGVFFGTRRDDGTSSRDTSSTSRNTSGASSIACVEKQRVAPRECIFSVSTYQMYILTLFNDYEKLTYEELRNKTEIPEKDLTTALNALAVGELNERVLVKQPETSQIEVNHVFTVNDFFSIN